jgi:thiol-disulfide isomerase/thioredoxin
VPPGIIALIAALGVAVVTGLAWQRTNGRMRPVSRRRSAAGRAQEAARASGATGQTAQTAQTGHAAQKGHAAQTGHAGQKGHAGQTGRADQAGPLITGAELGLPLGQRATLVQFSTAFCAPCRATRRILSEVAGMIEGVSHVEIDAESRLDLVRRLDIRRTPTVLVVGPDGRIAKRASGQPRKADVIAAVGDVS